MLTECAFRHERPQDLFENFELTNGCQFADSYEGDFVEHDGKMYCPFHAPEGLGDSFERGTFAKFLSRSAELADLNRIEEGNSLVGIGEQKYWDYLCNQTKPTEAEVEYDGTATIQTRWKCEITTDESLHRAIHAYAGLLELEIEPQRVTDLSGVRFPRDFVYYQLHSSYTAGEKKDTNPILLDKAVFEEDAVFNLLRIDGPLSATGAIFKKDAHFQESVFLGHCDFGSATFHGYADFFTVETKMIASFGFAYFLGDATFDNARFEVSAELNGAEFSGLASFENALFGNLLNCEGMKVLGDLDLSASIVDEARAAIPGDNDYNSPSTFPETVFQDARFAQHANFSNRTFNAKTDFSRAVFEIAPEFHNATLHQNTDFSGARFRDVASEGAVRAYRTLKLAMENVRASNEEADFFALEQRALRRRKDTPISVKLVSWLYERISDYGRSFTRPLTYLALLTWSFVTVLHSLMRWLAPVESDTILTNQGELAYLQELLQFALEQSIRPFAIWSPRYAELKGGMVQEAYQTAPLILGGISALVSVLVLAIVAMFLLALRQRFKMKG